MFNALSIYTEVPVVVPTWVIISSATMLGLALIFALIRFFLGPKTPDRIVAFDLLSSLVMALLLFTGITTGSDFYLQTVLGFSLILFIGTVALARYLDRPVGVAVTNEEKDTD